MYDTASSNGFPVLKTERLMLRQITRNDLANIYKGLSHPEVIKYYGISFDSLEATWDQLTWFRELERSKTGIWWAICNKNIHTFCGACGLYNISKEHKKAETGFWILPEYWGQGIISEAVTAMLQFSFDKMKLHRIEAQVETENLKCLKVMDNLRFRYEGTMKECEIKNGQFIDLYLYARLNI